MECKENPNEAFVDLPLSHDEPYHGRNKGSRRQNRTYHRRISLLPSGQEYKRACEQAGPQPRQFSDVDVDGLRSLKRTNLNVKGVKVAGLLPQSFLPKCLSLSGA